MSRNEDMIVRFSGLKPGIYNYHFTLDSAFFAEQKNEEITGGHVAIAAKMERKEHLLMFDFAIEGELDTWCDRCLGELKVPISGNEKLCVRFSDSEQSNDEEMEILPDDAFEIDLGQRLYEYAAVRLPMRHVHAEGECDATTAALIATDEAIAEKRTAEPDPRWEALRGLKDTPEGDNK